MSRILIIGGTGLISTAVAQQLCDRGDTLTLFNRGKTPSRVRGSVTLLAGDRTDLAGFEAKVRAAGPWDVVIEMIVSDPAAAESLARACKGRAGQVIFCSTTNVYPKPADSYPVREDHRLGAAFTNGQDKIVCERILREAEANGDFRLTVIRPGHSYGEGGGVLNSLAAGPSFLDRIRAGKPLVVHGDGNGLWSALHVEDVARVFAAAAGNSVAFGQTYNATGTAWFTWNQYHAAVSEAAGAPCPPLAHLPAEVLGKLAPARAAQTLRSLQYPGIYDMSRAVAELGFRQQVSLVAGMRRTIGWLAENGKIEPWETDPDYDRVLNAWQSLSRACEPATQA